MKKFTTHILEIFSETYETKTFRLENTAEISFIPGQYCLVSIPGHEKFAKVTRPFTFSNSPSCKKYFELTIKKMGEFTQALFQLKIGDQLEIKGPLGEILNFTPEISQDLVFLTGGSGITPFISIIRYIIEKKLPNRIFLLYGNRSEQDIIFHKELEKLKQHAANSLKVIHILENAIPGWTGEKGRISLNLIEKYVPDPKSKIWFLCGPPPMMIAMKSALTNMEIPEAHWRIEPWELPGKIQS